MSAGDDFAAKTSLAVSSIEFCQEIFDESNIWIRLGGGGGHRVMIPLSSHKQATVIAGLADEL